MQTPVVLDWSTSFDKAITAYLSELSDKERDKSFIFISTRSAKCDPIRPDSLDVKINEIRTNSQQTKAKQKFAAISEEIVLAIKGYTGIINTFTSVDPLHAATVWGVVNVIVDCADRYFQVEGLIHSQLQEMAGALRQIETNGNLYGESPHMRTALCNAYMAILRFWDLAYRKLESKGLTSFRRALSDRTLRQLKGVIETIKRHVETINTEARLIIHSRFEADRQAKELEAIWNWLNCRDCQDIKRVAQPLLAKLRKDMTCDCHWLEENPTYNTWVNFAPSKGQKDEPVLWLQADPGTGKSTLSSHVIETISAFGPDAVVAYHFYRFDHSFEPIMILKFLALQLWQTYSDSPSLQNNPGLAAEGPRKLLESMRLEDPSWTRIQELILALIKALPRVYFILDGLDEEHNDGKRQELVGHLADVASRHSDKVHLWCSSQPHPTLIALRERTLHRLLDVNAKMKDRVQCYLKDEVPKLPASISQEWKTRILDRLMKRVEGNFMWAKLVMSEISKAKSEGIIRDILNGNCSIGTYYQRYFSRFVNSDRELACMIFALVAFAKRPLKIEELTDAVAMLRSKNKCSLDPEERIFEDKLLEFVSPLITIYNDSDGASGTKRCRLVHSTVHDFLVHQSNILYDDKFCRMHVDPLVIANACLLYLNQECFSHLLIQKGREWRDKQDVPVEEHPFLFYSAKYWDKHLDDVKPPFRNDLLPNVEAFITSGNFLTCMQVQSIWVALQFAVFTKTGERQESKYFRRVFPKWFAETERGQQLWSNYLRYLHDWKTLLCRRTGEVDRCWWGALGPHNFLSRHKGRYRTFCVQPREGELYEGPMFQAFSPLGDVMKVLRMSLESSDGNLTFSCEHWTQRGQHDPSLEKSQIINTTESATNWAAYMSRRSFRTTVNKPSGSEVKDDTKWIMLENSASPVSFSEDCGHVRIGAQVFTLSCEGTYVALPGLDAEADNSARYVEELAGRGRYVVLASRKAEPPKEDSHPTILHLVIDLSEDDDDTAVEKINLILLDKAGHPILDVMDGPDSGVSSGGDFSVDKPEDDRRPDRDDEYADKSSGDEDEDEDEVESDNHDPTDEESAAHESWSECSSESTADSQFADEKMTPWASLLAQDVRSETETSDTESDLSAQDLELVQSNSTESSDSDEHKGTAVDAESIMGTTKVEDSENSSEEASDVPREAFFGFRQTWRDEDDEYSADESDDAPEFAHHYIAHEHLSRMKRTAGRGSQSRVFVRVFDTSQTSPTRILAFSHDVDFLLHDSPPAVHPTAPLVVWPLSTGNVLFANFENNSYFIRRLRPSTPRTRQVVMKFHFSPCGRYLHVASLEGQRHPSFHTKTEPCESEKIIKFSLLVATYRLCKTDPSRRPPCLVHRVKVKLEDMPCPKPADSHTMILYTITWSPDALFFTCTDRILKVYRISLFNERREALDCKNFVHMQPEPIFLPDSAMERKVYFFPLTAKTDDRTSTAIPARVVISAAKHAPLSSANARDKSSPPLVCFLKEAHLGEWQEESSLCKEIPKDRGVGRFDEHLEAFDSEEDCDLEFYTAD